MKRIIMKTSVVLDEPNLKAMVVIVQKGSGKSAELLRQKAGRLFRLERRK